MPEMPHLGIDATANPNTSGDLLKSRQ